MTTAPTDLPPARPPRYTTEVTANGLRRIVRTDGERLGYVPPTSPRRRVSRVQQYTDSVRVDSLDQALAAARSLRTHMRAVARERAPLPPDDAAPNGDELRRMRAHVGLSQRELQAASGLSRSLIAEIERGRRKHVLARLRLAEVLTELARVANRK